MGNRHTTAKALDQRVTRCLQSFEQLQADVRHINVHCAGEFARVEQPLADADGDDAERDGTGGGVEVDAEPSVLHFRPYCKLVKSSSLRWLWKINDNIVVVACIVPKSEADRRSAAPATASNGTVTAAAASSSSSASASASASASSSSSSSPAPTAAPLHTRYPSYILTLREFYTLFIYYVDQLAHAAVLREQILKIEHPQEWARKQQARRREQQGALQRATRKQTPGGEGEGEGEGSGSSCASDDAKEEEEEKSASSDPLAAAAAHDTLQSLRSLSRAGSMVSDDGRSAGHVVATLTGHVPQECCICLGTPEEDAQGGELIVLSCLHSFCEECIEQWRSHSATCPLCRRELADTSSSSRDGSDPESDDSWILTSPDLSQLKRTHARLLAYPFEFVRGKAPFPPPGQATKGIKTPADAFSLIAGEVIEVIQQAQGGRRSRSRSNSAHSSNNTSSDSSSNSNHTAVGDGAQQATATADTAASASSASSSSSSSAPPLSVHAVPLPLPLAHPVATSPAASQ